MRLYLSKAQNMQQCVCESIVEGHQPLCEILQGQRGSERSSRFAWSPDRVLRGSGRQMSSQPSNICMWAPDSKCTASAHSKTKGKNTKNIMTFTMAYTDAYSNSTRWKLQGIKGERLSFPQQLPWKVRRALNDRLEEDFRRQLSHYNSDKYLSSEVPATTRTRFHQSCHTLSKNQGSSFKCSNLKPLLSPWPNAPPQQQV